jgi:hypothetical protein
MTIDARLLIGGVLDHELRVFPDLPRIRSRSCISAGAGDADRTGCRHDHQHQNCQIAAVRFMN